MWTWTLVDSCTRAAPAPQGNTDRSRTRVIKQLESKLAKYACAPVLGTMWQPAHESFAMCTALRTLTQHKEFQAGAADYLVQLEQLSTVVDSIFHKSECDQMSGLRDTWSRPEEKKISASDTALTTDIAILHCDTHPMVRPALCHAG